MTRKDADLNPPAAILSRGKEPGTRLTSLDALRGLIMILMAVDHAAHLIAKTHPSEFWGIPLPQYDSVFAFLTRFVTHLCAPGFFLLMGAGMAFFAHSRRALGWSEIRIVRYFAIRGGILILLQLNLENSAWLLGSAGGAPAIIAPGADGQVWIHLGVLYALGCSMILCSLLTRLHPAIVMIGGILTLLIAPIMMPSSDGAALAYPALFRMLVVPGQTGILQVFYPVLPWLGIAMFGLVLGRELIGNRHQAYRRTLFAGAICLILFFILRSYGGFGNYHPLAGESWIDFLNLTKYPPSLTFVLWTVGVNALLLWGFAALQDSIEKHGKALLVFGKTALFFYILHLYMFALVGFLFPTGLNLALMYLTWGAGLAVLYRLCRWYLSFKQRTSPDSLWRFF